MPRVTRSSKKATAPVSEPRSTRSKRGSIHVVAESSHGEDNAIISTPNPSIRSASTRRRQTRSQHLPLASDEVKSSTKKRRKRKQAEEIKNETPKRLRSDDRREQSPEERKEDEEGAPRDAFFDNINKNILPTGTPETSREQRANHDQHEDNTENHSQEEASQIGPGGTPRSNDQEEPEPSIIQLGPKRGRGRPRKKRQRKKVTYGEVEEASAREASVELGSDTPARRQPQLEQPELQEHQGNTKRVESEKDLYDVDNIDDDDDQIKPKGPNKESGSLAGEEDGEEPERPEELAEQDEQDEEYEPDEEEQPQHEKSTMMIAEDSIFVDAHNEDESAPAVAQVPSETLNVITSLIGLGGWTGIADWKPKFIMKDKQSKAQWLKSHEKALQPARCLKFFAHLHHLWEFFVEMPRSPEWTRQSAYLRENANQLKKSIANINTYVEHICNKMQPWVGRTPGERDPDYSWGQQALETLYTKLVPMFILILEESFKAGGVVTVSNGKEIALPDEGHFTSSTLQMPLRIVGWLQRLCNIIESDIATRYHPKMSASGDGPMLKDLNKSDRHRKRMCDQLLEMREGLQGGLKQLEYITTAPERERIARERDRAIQESRREKQHAIHNAQERQMQLFVESLQRMRPSNRSEPQRSPSEEYFDKHGGWNKQEDERLLDMVRKVEKPNVKSLAPLVPGRSVEEVAQRVRDLRERMRLKFSQAGMEPPLWCYETK
ncbi:hypothetical protein B0T10DRAFT_489959 [Thelonectria olida]|uniref:Myb-like domain-containing protein n=1 Tax=Thelonectria olida TaxID=1576542 RepID=A0A9P8W1A4_9HYPO|nr:hypothetical protein B0T10DRAFT_489959 [Thelonectria olida]